MCKHDLPQRRRLRAQGYDYASSGAYFVTICTGGKACTLGYVDDTVGQGLCPCRLSQTGAIVEDEIGRLPERFPTIAIDKHVVMPNHVHLLLSLKAADSDERLDPVGQGLCPCRGPAKTSAVERQGQSPCPTSGSERQCRPTLGDIIGAFKSLTTKRVNAALETPGRKLWQPRFHDHIVRGEEDYEAIWRYIEENPIKWSEDAYFSLQERG